MEEQPLRSWLARYARALELRSAPPPSPLECLKDTNDATLRLEIEDIFLRQKILVLDVVRTTGVFRVERAATGATRAASRTWTDGNFLELVRDVESALSYGRSEQSSSFYNARLEWSCDDLEHRAGVPDARVDALEALVEARLVRE